MKRHAYKSFMERKYELMEQRLEYYKANNMQDYLATIMKASQEFTQRNLEVETLAIEYIDLEQQNLIASVQEAMMNPEVK